MKKISLTLKIIVMLITVSIATLAFLYYVFYNLFQERMLQAEKEKAVLIAQTIEPMIGMNYYLNLNDEIKQLAEQTIEHANLASLHIVIKDEEIFFLPYDDEQEHIHIEYPIKDPVAGVAMGIIDVSYPLDNFYQAFDDIKSQIIRYLAALAVVFFFFSFITRRLLRPLGQIAEKVKHYQLGSKIEFSEIRTEPETNAIIDAFGKMVSNIREYTILLERYKYAVDESAIVSKIDTDGNITYVNDEFCRISGYEREELIGKNHNVVCHSATQDEATSDLWKTLQEKKVWKGINKNKSKDGKPYYVKTTVVPIFDETDRTVEYIGIHHDITQIVEQQEKILKQTTDLLTGLPNRIKLEEDLELMKSPKFAFIALDNYLMIKDYYGLEAGYQTLKETGKLLESLVVGHNVQVYKLSASEFGLLKDDDTDVKKFKNICSDVLEKIDDHVVNIGDDSFSINATAGLAYSKENILSHASLALHHALEKNKSLLVYEHTENLIEYYENNMEWTKRLKRALHDDRIVVYAQPIVDAKSMLTNKYECLVRMIGEDGKIISPFFFLEIAKKAKLYPQLTRRVISLAFEAFSKLPDKSFSINLTLEDLINAQTMEFLKAKIKEYDIASRLILEIVESEEIENFTEIIPLINEMKSLGCKIAIDDFGTGYSNFSYLLQLNIDYIKIDGSIIKSIDHDMNSQIILRTILDFAGQLGYETVAEFVHNEKVQQYTQSMGINYLQGFHLSEPVALESILVPVH